MIDVSVVIATRGRTCHLRRCLQSLAAQTHPPEQLEAIVVGSGSGRRVRRTLRAIGVPFRLRSAWEPDGGCCAARNRGAALASGDVLLFLDDDLVADPRLVAEHVDVHRDSGDVVVLQRVDAGPPMAATGDAAIPIGFQTRVASVPTALFAAVRGFACDLPAGQDTELAFRLAEAGARFVHRPGADGWRTRRVRPGTLVAGAEAAGRADVVLYRRRPALLEHLDLGRFHEASLREVVARRLLLALGCPARPLGLLASVGRGKRMADALARYAYWRGVRRATADRETWRSLTNGVRILMYHACARPGEPGSTYVVPAPRLARQMRWLARRRYHVIGLEEHLASRREHRLPPPKAVVLTFDDGYADNAEVAYPILRRYGFPATIFLVTGMGEAANRWDGTGPLAGRPLLEWETVRSMCAGGVTAGGHTRTHPRLTEIAPERARAEIRGSRDDLERAVGPDGCAFAYPHGDYNARLASDVERAGFAGACTSDPGTNDPATSRFRLRRLEVRGGMSLPDFALMLAFGADRVVDRLRHDGEPRRRPFERGPRPSRPAAPW